MARHETPDFRDRMEYLAFESLLGALRSPPLPWGQRLGWGLGGLVDRCIPVRRREAMDNLRHAFPDRTEAERRLILRGMWQSFTRTVAEFARFGGRTPLAIRDLVDLVNPEAFAEAQAAGQGALLLTAHFGNWEALGAAASAHGYPVTLLGARQRNPLVERLLAGYRGQVGLCEHVNVGESLRPVVRALRQGSFVATLADQDGGRRGFAVPFLGRPASVQAGLFRIIARTGVPLITGFSVRDGRRWRGELQSPVWPGPVSSPEEAEAEALRLATVYTNRVESYVRRYPDHWFWIHRRWKTRPEDMLPGPPDAAGTALEAGPPSAESAASRGR